MAALYFSLSFSLPCKCFMNSTLYVLRIDCFILFIDFFKLKFLCLSKFNMCIVEGGKLLQKKACKKEYQSSALFLLPRGVPLSALLTSCSGIFSLHL